MLLSSKSNKLIKRDKQQDKVIHENQVAEYEQDYNNNINKMCLNDFTMHVLLRLYSEYNNHIHLPLVNSEYKKYLNQLFFLAKLGLLNIEKQDNKTHIVTVQLQPLGKKLTEEYFLSKSHLRKQFTFKDRLAVYCKRSLILGTAFLILIIILNMLQVTMFNSASAIIGIALTIVCVASGTVDMELHDKILDNNKITLITLLEFLKKNTNKDNYYQAQRTLTYEYVRTKIAEAKYNDDDKTPISEYSPIYVDSING